MFPPSSPAQIESLLRLDLEAAEERLRKATPGELPEVRQYFRAALRRFAAFVLDGEAPTDLLRM
jgi:hypothetical protein